MYVRSVVGSSNVRRRAASADAKLPDFAPPGDQAPAHDGEPGAELFVEPGFRSLPDPPGVALGSGAAVRMR